MAIKKDIRNKEIKKKGEEVMYYISEDGSMRFDGKNHKAPNSDKKIKCSCVCHRSFPKLKGYCQSCEEFHNPAPVKKGKAFFIQFLYTCNVPCPVHKHTSLNSAIKKTYSLGRAEMRDEILEIIGEDESERWGAENSIIKAEIRAVNLFRKELRESINLLNKKRKI